MFTSATYVRCNCLLTIMLSSFSGIHDATAIEVFASSFFSPAPADEDPGLHGVMKIDLATGTATTFIPENAAVGFSLLADVAVGPHDGLLYVGTQPGLIFRFDAQTGLPLPGETNGVFAQLFGAANGLLFDDAGTLYVAEIGQAGGAVPSYDTSGNRQAGGPTGLSFPSGLTLTPDGKLLVGTGGQGVAGQIEQFVGGVGSTLIPSGDLGGFADLTILHAEGDFDNSGSVDANDYNTWRASYGTANPLADSNNDGTVDAAEYTVWRDHQGEEARLLTVDLELNNVASYALDGTDRQELVPFVPPALPVPLPAGVDPSNSPSEVLVTPQGTLLLTTLGLTRRPDNRAAILEYDRQGNLLGTLIDGLPPISGIAFAPEPLVETTSVPEPTMAWLAWVGTAMLFRSESRRPT